MRVLVNNIHSTNSTSLVKMLKRIKKFPVEVWGTDIEKNGYIAASNLADKYFQSPDIDDETTFFTFIKKLCNDNKIDIVFVSSDKEVRFMSKYKEQINSIIINPEHDIVNLFSNKYNASIALKELGILSPPIIKDFFNSQKKVIFRKKQSVSSLGIYIVDLSIASLIENHFNNEWFAQEYIEGSTYVADVLCDKCGTPHLIVPKKRLEIQNGSTFRCQIVKHDRIINLCKKIYNHYKVPGISDIEFIEDKSGNLYFIELNMRIGGSASEGMIASFNYVEQYLEHFVFNKELEPLNYYMKCVGWDSVVSRFHEETIYHEDDLSQSKSYVQKDK